MDAPAAAAAAAARLQLPGLRSDREGDAEGEVPIEVAVHLSGHHQVVVEAPEQRPLAGLRIAPELIQWLLIREPSRL